MGVYLKSKSPLSTKGRSAQWDMSRYVPTKTLLAALWQALDQDEW